MAQFKLKRMSRQVGLRRCGGCQIFPAAQFLLNAFNGLDKHLGLCERTRIVSSGLGSPVGELSHAFRVSVGQQHPWLFRALASGVEPEPSIAHQKPAL